MIDLALVWSSTSVPEKEPLKSLVSFQFVFESKLVFLVVDLEQIQQLGRSLDDGEGRRLVVVDQDGNSAIGVETQEPFLLLFVGGDVDEGGGPGGAVRVCEFFEKNLCGLSVGRALRDQMQALGFFDVLGRFRNIEVVCHG